MNVRPMILTLAISTAAACGAAGAGASDGAPRPTEVAPAAWLELGGARMLVTTTRAAHGRTDADLPIVIALSWSRSTPAEILREVGYAEIDVPARVIAIEGFERDGDGFSWWRRTRPAPGDPDHDDELAALLIDRARRLASVIEQVRAHVRSPSPPVVSGISQGGDLSIALAVLHPGVIAAALPIASRFPASLWPSAAPATTLPPIDAFHGAADVIAPTDALQRAVAALHERGYPVVLHLYDGAAHEVSPAERADVQACAALRLRGRTEPCRSRRAGAAQGARRAITSGGAWTSSISTPSPERGEAASPLGWMKHTS